MFYAHFSRVVAVTLMALPLVTAAATFDMTPAKQEVLDKQKTVIADWVKDAIILKAVKEQNAKGPIAGMDNARWKTLRASDDVVTSLAGNEAASFLRAKMDASSGLVSEAFLSGAQGEKVAFIEKTSSYIHKGSPKFDVPFTTGQAWQGKPEFDESSQSFAVQISVPVVDAGKNIGALVVGVNLTKLEKLTKTK